MSPTFSVAGRAGLDMESIAQATAAFFLKWNGDPVAKCTVPMLMRRFLRDCNCGHLKAARAEILDSELRCRW